MPMLANGESHYSGVLHLLTTQLWNGVLYNLFIYDNLCREKRGTCINMFKALQWDGWWMIFSSLLNKHSSSPCGFDRRFDWRLNRCCITSGGTITPHASVCTCPRRCSYSMLGAGKVRVTAWNYEYGVRGVVFPACSNGRGSLHLCLASALHVKCQVGSGGLSTASEWNVPSRFKVQSPEGPRDHLRPPTCFFFFSPLHLLLPLYCWQRISQIDAAKSFTLALWFNEHDSHGNWKMYDHAENQVALYSTGLWIDARVITALYQQLIVFPIVQHFSFQYTKITFNASAGTISAAWNQQVAV